jgi:putative phosphoesterase
MTRPIERVAAFYDVHGNLPALEAALADADAAGVDLIVLGGDLALGPMPCEVLDRISELGDRVRALRGNCDRLMVDAYDGRPLTSVPAVVQDSFTWAASQLHGRQRDFLAGLPETVTLEIDALGPVLFCHATPRSDEEIITVRTPDEHLRSIIASVPQPVIICGHTHMQFERRCRSARVINAGSVGMPYGSAGAHWLLLGPGVEFRRTAYDGIRAAERIERTSYPDAARFAACHVLHPPSEEAMLAAFESARPTREAPLTALPNEQGS